MEKGLMAEEILSRMVEKFDNLSYKEKKEIVITIENSLRANQFDLKENVISDLQFSNYSLDRITFYLWKEYKGQIDLNNDVINIRQEYQRVRTLTKKPSLIPLHYSIRQLKRTISPGQIVQNIRDDLQTVYSFLESKKDLDKNGSIKRNLYTILKPHEQSKVKGTVVSKEVIDNKIKTLISNGETLKALRYLLENKAHFSNFEERILLASNRLNRNKLSLIEGLATPEENRIEESKVVKEILLIINPLSPFLVPHIL